MKKADYEFNKNLKKKLNSQEKENSQSGILYNYPQPIHIPKRKKFKR